MTDMVEVAKVMDLWEKGILDGGDALKAFERMFAPKEEEAKPKIFLKKRRHCKKMFGRGVFSNLVLTAIQNGRHSPDDIAAWIFEQTGKKIKRKNIYSQMYWMKKQGKIKGAYDSFEVV